MSTPGILRYRYDIIPALIDAGVDVGAIGGSVTIESGVIDYMTVTRCHGRTRFQHVLRHADTVTMLSRWGIDASAGVVLFPSGVAQAVVTRGERVEGWILIDMTDVDLTALAGAYHPDDRTGGSEDAGRYECHK